MNRASAITEFSTSEILLRGLVEKLHLLDFLLPLFCSITGGDGGLFCLCQQVCPKSKLVKFAIYSTENFQNEKDLGIQKKCPNSHLCEIPSPPVTIDSLM